MGSWSFIQGTNTGGGNSAGAVTLAYPSNVTKGDLLIVIYGGWGEGGSTVAVTDSQSNTWNRAGSYSLGDGNNQVTSIWYTIAGSTGANTVSALPSSSVFRGLAIGQYRWSNGGLTLESVLDNTSSGNNGSTSAASDGSCPVSGSSELVIGGFGQSDANSSITSSFNVREQQTNDSFDCVYLLDTLSASLATNITGTFGSNFGWSGIAASFVGGSGGTNYTVSVAAGAFSIAGAAALISIGIMASTGSVSITGDPASLNQMVEAGTGSLSITSNPASLTQVANLGTGILLISGDGAELVNVINGSSGVVTITGYGAEISPTGDYNISANPGVFLITAMPVVVSTIFDVGYGSVSITGQPTTFIIELDTNGGSFAVTGFSASITVSGTQLILPRYEFPGMIAQRIEFPGMIAQRIDFSEIMEPIIFHVGDMVSLVVDITDEATGGEVNVSTASTITIRLEDPTGVKISKTGVLDTSGTNGKIRYNTTTSDLYMPGNWKIQGFVILASGQNSNSQVSDFKVLTNLV